MGDSGHRRWGRWGRWGMAVVRGRSMVPTFRGGDRLLVQYAAPVAAGMVVVARMPDGTLAVKRAVEERRTASGAPGWWLLSDNPDEGVDSRHRGPVAADQVLAVARVRLWPRPRVIAVTHGRAHGRARG